MTPVNRNRHAARDPEAQLRRCREAYDRLKADVATIGYLCQGTITRRTLSCGKPSCGCRKDPARRHGPYYYWTAKVEGRTQSRMLDPTLVPLYREAIRNHRRLQAALKKMRKVSPWRVTSLDLSTSVKKRWCWS